MDVFKIIEKPIVTERTGILKDKGNKYVFKVANSASKYDIKNAVQELFKVSVLRVNTMNVQGKNRRMGKYEGKKSDWKKAIVTLKKGQEIKTIEEKA